MSIPVPFCQFAQQYGFESTEPEFVPPLGHPTHAIAGSAEKLQILAKRYALGEALFHPDDSQLCQLQAGYKYHYPQCKTPRSKVISARRYMGEE